MGSTRQIFSEDRHQTSDTKTGPCPLVATNTKIHLIIKFFWSDRFTTNRKYFNNREIFETALSELFKKHWKIRTSDENLEDICVLFLQLFLISLQRNLSVVAFKTKTFFFHLLKSWKKLILTTQSSQAILSCPPGK